jgi:gas vesicle protein
MSDIQDDARSMGWRPKEDFRGDPDKWVDAETFVDRGRHFLPILRANNSKLEEANRRLNEELTGIKSLLNASQDSIKALTEFQSTETRRQVTEVKKQIVERLRTAREDGSIEQETALLDELADIRATEKSFKETPAAPPAPKPSADTDPALQNWMGRQENAWFGKDVRRTALAVAIGQEMRNDSANNKLVGEAFFDKVAQEVEAIFSPGSKESPDPSIPSSKVEGSRGGSGGSGGSGGGKTYASLPAEAKSACSNMSKRMVGDGRAFKTTADWQAHYTSVYFSQE